jgi:hypothetical protein
MAKYRQEPPFAVQIELTEGCQLRCTFCGLNGIRGKDNDFRFMTVETIRSVAEQMVEAGWNSRVEFAMHGEPTMHPDYVGMVAAFHEAAPKLQLMMTSNGGGLLKKPGIRENVLALFRSGLTTLALDDYEGVKIVGKVRKEFVGHAEPTSVDYYTVERGGVMTTDIDVYEYPVNRAGSPHARRRRPAIVLIQDISVAAKGNHSTLNNHSGAAAPLDESQAHSLCAKPFREMSIRWDGNVAICCNDWRGHFKAGSVLRDRLGFEGHGLEDTWNGAAMDGARRRLMQRQRDFGPCKGCNATSYRVGLLPDKMGKATMPRPTPQSNAAIAAALKGAPYTAPVLRPWEAK